MKATDLREKSLQDLVELRKSLAGDMFQNRLRNFTNRLDDTSSIRKARRDLARVLTVIRQVELRSPGAAAAPPAPEPVSPPAASPAQDAPKAKRTSKRKAEGETAAAPSAKKSSKKSEASSR
jgi:large subunit ribosomal protein L29